MMYNPYEAVYEGDAYYIHESSYIDYSSGVAIKRTGRRISSIPYKSSQDATSDISKLLNFRRY